MKTKRGLLGRINKRSVLKGAAWTAAVVVTLWVLLAQIANWRGARAWQEARARLESSGEVRTMEALVPAAVPDAENFFGTALLRGLNRVDGVDKNTNEGPHGEQRRRVEAMYPLRKEGELRPPREGRSGRRTGAGRDYVGLLAYVRKAGTLEVGEGGGVEVLLDAMNSEYGQEFAELEAAAERRFSRIESNLLRLDAGEMLFSVQVPHFQPIQSLAKTMRLRAGLAAASGNGETARKSIEVILRLAEGAAGEPLYIMQLVAQTVERMAIDGMWEGLEARCFSGEDLASLQAAFEAIDLDSGYLAAMRGELLASLDALDMFSRGGRESAMLLSTVTGLDGGGGTQPGLVVNTGVMIAPGGWLNQNRATMVNWALDYQIEPMKTEGLAGVVARSEAFTNTIIEAKTSWWRLPHTLIPCLIMPAMDTIGRSMVHHRAVLDECVVACALERFRLGDGGYPEALGELVPRYLKEVPKDQHREAAISYRREDEGFLLWTIGPDGEDDGGAAGDVKNASGVNEANERSDRFVGDWVWRQRVGVVAEGGE